MDQKQYYDGLVDVIMKQYNGDATWGDVVNYRELNGIKTTYDYVQRGSAVLMELLRAGYRLTPVDGIVSEEEPKENGIISSVIKFDGDKQTKTYDDI